MSQLNLYLAQLGVGASFLRFEIEQRVPPFSCTCVRAADGTEVGVSRGQPSKAAAQAFAAQLAFQYLLDNPPTPPPLPPPPPSSNLPSLRGSYTYATEAATPQRLAHLFAILGETSGSYQEKITRHVRRCGLDDADLEELAWAKRKEHEGEGGHSPGRRFHDAVKTLRERAGGDDVL